jgi:hypothetical protein
MKNFYKALAGFQQECPVMLKDTEGYGYKYVDLPKIIHIINPIMKKHGLGFTQKLGTNPETNNSCLETTIFHVASGEFDTSKVDIPLVDLKGQNIYQSFGSGTTYYRRYALSSALGIVSDKDLDAYGEQMSPAKEVKPKEKKPKLENLEEILMTILEYHKKGQSLEKIYNRLMSVYDIPNAQLTKIKKEVNARIK